MYFFIRNRLPILYTYFLLILFGAIAFYRCEIVTESASPALTASVYANANGSAEMIDSRVALFLIEELKNVPNVGTVYSVSNPGMANITLLLQSEMTHVDEKNIRAAIQRVMTSLPSYMRVPEFMTGNLENNVVFQIGLVLPEGIDKSTIRYEVGYLLNALKVSGVSTVRASFDPVPAYNIELSIPQMNHHGISSQQMKDAFQKLFDQQETASIATEHEKLAITVVPRKLGSTFEEAISRSFVMSEKGVPIQLSKLVKVTNKQSDRSFVSVDGKEAIMLEVYKTQGANVMKIASEVLSQITELNKWLKSKGMSLVVSDDRTKYVRDGLHEVATHTLVEAVVSSLIVIYVFLRSFRASLIPLFAIPASILPSFIVFYLFSIPVNILTILGIILSIGIAVDDAIVLLEKIQADRNLYPHKSVEDVVYGSLSSIRTSLITMGLILSAAFMPIIFSPGNSLTSKYIPFAGVIGLSILNSVLVAIFLTPVLYCMLMRGESIPDPAYLIYIDRIYKNVTSRLVEKYKILTPLLLSTLFIMLAIYGKKIEYGLDPAIDTSEAHYAFIPKENTSYEYMKNKTENIHRLIKKSRVGKYVDMVMLRLDDDKKDYSVGVSLVPILERRGVPLLHLKEDIGNVIRSCGFSGEVQERSHSSGDNTVVLYVDGMGHDVQPSLTRKAFQIMSRFQPGIQRILTSSIGQEIVGVVTLDNDLCQEHGISVSDIGNLLHMYNHSIYTPIAHSMGQSKIYMYLDIKDVKEMLSVPIDTRKGLVLLKDLVDHTSPIKQKNEKSVVRVNSNHGLALTIPLEKESMIKFYSTTFPEVKKEFDKQKIIPSSLNMKKVSDYMDLAGMLVTATSFVSWVLISQFKSFRKVFVIVGVTIPSAILGALMMLHFKGDYLSVISMVGLITLTGLITKHGILIVEMYDDLRRLGKSVFDSVVESASHRFRAVLMTTICMASSSFVMMMYGGQFYEYQNSIGRVIFGGMLFGTFITIVILPIVLYAVEIYLYPQSKKSE